MISRTLFKTTQNLLQSSQKFGLVNTSCYTFAGRKFSEKLNDVRNGPTINVDIPQGSAGQALASNAGLNNYIMRVYKASGAGVMTALATSQLAVASGIPFASPYGAMFGGLIASIGGMFATMKMSPTTVVDKLKTGEEVLRTENSPIRLGTYGLTMAGLGLSASPLFAMLSYQNPAILPTSILISAGIFGSASLYAYSRPKDSLISWGSSLYSALFGMIGLQIVGGLTHLVIGPNMFSTCLHRADTFVGVGLFSAMIAYDTHCAIKSYEEGNADHLLTSLDFALDFWNVLVRVSQILSMFSGND